jgi:HemY protein
MLRILSYVIRAALLIALVVWLADHPGAVSLDWLGWHVETSFAVLAGAGLLLLALVVLLVRLGGRILRGPRNLRRNREMRRLRDGYRALTAGLTAVAAGEADAARRQANRAARLLDQKPLAMLITAQAAQIGGDDAAARRAFTALLADPETEFLGRRGLAALEMKAGDSEAALAHAERALDIHPGAPALIVAIAELHARRGEWAEYSRRLDQAAKAKALPAAELAHKRALAALGESGEAEAAGRLEAALTLAERAVKASPRFMPAIAAKARLEIAKGNAAKASHTIERAWRASPHRDLAAFYARDAEPLARLKRMERLVALAPDDGESYLAIGDAALAAKLWGEARRHYGRAAELSGAAQARAYRSLAEIEKQEHQDFAKAESWHMQALAAPSDPGWRCRACDQPAAAWQPRCPACGTADGLGWRAEGQSGAVVKAAE